MFIDDVVVRVWGPEKVFKFYLSRCWEKGFISCHQHVTISSFERFFFSRRKDSSFPAPGWEDSLFPGAGSRSRRRLSSRRRLKPSSFPSAGWKLSSLAGRKTSNRGDIQYVWYMLLKYPPRTRSAQAKAKDLLVLDCMGLSCIGHCLS